jgi:hypothetical protein
METEDSPTEDWKETYRTSREAAVNEVQNKYLMTEEEKDEFILNPDKILPKLAANLYVDVFESVLGAVNEMLPGRVQQLNGISLEAAQKTEQFYDAWPDLKTVKGQEQIMRIGQVYRSLNRDATSEEFIRDVGTQASVALGIPIPGITALASVEETPAPAFKPGGPGGAAIPVASDPRESDNQFEVLNAEWDDDDKS